MTRRNLVKAVIAHKPTNRIPYFIRFTGDGEKELQKAIGPRSALDFADNDIIEISPPWWGWNQLGEDWTRMDSPSTPSGVTGTGSYSAFFK